MKKPLDVTRLSKAKQYLLGEYTRLHQEHERSNNAFKLVREMNHWIDESKDQGFHDMAKLNQMLAGQIANQAILYEDKEILDFIGHIETAGGNNYGNTLYAQDLVRKVGAQIDRQKDQDERRSRETLQWNRSEEQRNMLLKIGEFYNNQENPPSDEWDVDTEWKWLKKELNTLGMYESVKAIEDRKHTLDERNQSTSRISLEELQGNKALRTKLMDLVTDEGDDGLYSWGLRNRSFDPDALDYLVKQADTITPYSSIQKFGDASTYFQRFLNNFAAVKVKEFLPGFNDDPMKHKPKGFDPLVQSYMLRYHDIIKDAYYKITRMDKGNRDYDNWTADQQKAFTEALNINRDYNKESTPLDALMRDADTQLSGLMDSHLSKNKNYFDTSVITRPDVTEFYTRVFGEKPPSGKKMHAKDLLIELERAKLRASLSNDTFDTDFENYIEDVLLEGSGINFSAPANAAEREAIGTAYKTLQQEVMDLIKKEEEGAK